MKNAFCKYRYVFAVVFAVLVSFGCKKVGNPVAPPDTSNNAVTIISPNGGETFGVGDTVAIKWTTNPDSSIDVMIYLTLELQQIPITTQASVYHEDDNWGNFIWVIPAEMNSVKIAGQQARIKIEDYDEKGMFDVSDASFMINAQ